MSTVDIHLAGIYLTRKTGSLSLTQITLAWQRILPRTQASFDRLHYITECFAMFSIIVFSEITFEDIWKTIEPRSESFIAANFALKMRPAI